MDVEQIREFALSLDGSQESFPFGPDNLVFKVNGKMFLLLSLDAIPLQFNVKCDPDEALLLREEYACVLPGYHMNKKHWNTIKADGTLSSHQLKEMIKTSWKLVQKKK